MVQDSHDRPSVINLSLAADRPLPLSPALREQWADLLRLAGEYEAPVIIFLAMLLGILDNDPAPRFSHVSYEQRDMFGGCDNDWTVSTKRASIHRVVKQQINESWQHVDVEADSVEIRGLADGISIEWDGEHVMSVKLMIRGLAEAQGKAIERLAREMFANIKIPADDIVPPVTQRVQSGRQAHPAEAVDQKENSFPRTGSNLASIIRDLEICRREIAVIESGIGSMGDYLDRGCPDEQEHDKTEREMKSEHERLCVARERLHALVTRITSETPEALQTWVEIHKSVCKQIIAGGVDDDKADTRLFVARETIDLWDQVRRGEKDYVSVNAYYLENYDELFDRLMETR